MPAACSSSPPVYRLRPRLGSVAPWWIPSVTALRGALVGRCRSAPLIRSISASIAGCLRAVNLWMGSRVPVQGPGPVPAVAQWLGATLAALASMVWAAGWKIGSTGCSRTRTTGGSPGSRNGWRTARLAGPPPGPRSGRSSHHPGRIQRPARRPVAVASRNPLRPDPEPALVGPWRRCRGGRAVARMLRKGLRRRTGLIRRTSRCPVGNGLQPRVHHRLARARRHGRGRFRSPGSSQGRMPAAEVDEPCRGPAAGVPEPDPVKAPALGDQWCLIGAASLRLRWPRGLVWPARRRPLRLGSGT